MRCTLCGWPLDDEHIFNVRCALANAEADQIEAEVDEIRECAQKTLSAEDQRYFEIGLEIARDVIALARFNRDAGGY